MSKKRRILIAAVALLVAAVGLFAVWKLTAPKTQAGGKTVTVEVVSADDSYDKTYTISTEAEYLYGAIVNDSEIELEGSDGDYGFFITAVDGIAADYEANGSWWCLTSGGEMLSTGVSDTPVADGDAFELTLTVG